MKKTALIILFIVIELLLVDWRIENKWLWSESEGIPIRLIERITYRNCGKEFKVLKPKV